MRVIIELDATERGIIEQHDAGCRNRAFMELQIVCALIDTAKASGYTFAGEYGEIDTSTDDTLKASLFNLDEVRLQVFDNEGRYVGWIYLVFGNDGWDLISDYTMSLESFLAPVNQLARRLEFGFAGGEVGVTGERRSDDYDTGALEVPCQDCQGKGWDVFNEDPETGNLGNIERCDTCKSLATDTDAEDAARAAGYIVDADGNVLAKPNAGETGRVLHTFRDEDGYTCAIFSGPESFAATIDAMFCFPVTHVLAAEVVRLKNRIAQLECGTCHGSGCADCTPTNEGR